MKIGYQGAVNSNNHLAAKHLAAKLDIQDAELLPLVQSINVVNALRRGEIDFGVMAHQNSYAGLVTETYEALRKEALEQVSTVILDINHAFFVNNDQIKPEEITKVASHEMALKQCRKSIEQTFPNAEVMDVGSTSLAAEYLSSGKYDNQTAVICTPEAGQDLNLFLIAENVQDELINKTEFRLYKKRSKAKSNSFLRRILFTALDNRFVRLVLQVSIVAMIFGGLYLKDFYRWSNLDYATNLGPIIVAITLFLTSKGFESRLKAKALTGYWKYNAISDDQKEDVLQRFIVPRVVKIDKVKNDYKLTGYIVDQPNSVYFESTQTSVKLGEKSGSLVYWYNVKDRNAAKYSFRGIAFLEWQLERDSDIICKMDGRYYGDETKDIGSLSYVRISENEFNNLVSADYLNPKD